MPIKNYGVLVGRVTDFRVEAGRDSPHFQLRVNAGGTSFRIAVNVRSTDPGAPELLFRLDEDFRHAVTAQVSRLGTGFHPLPRPANGLSLDYVRGGFVHERDLKALPHDLPGPDNDLNEKIGRLAARAKGANDVMVYAFGARWGPEVGEKDQVFRFSPGNGVHDIHMNQGNPPGRHFGDNGADQDGALLFHFEGENRWVAVFLAFQSQSWETDAAGNPRGTGTGTGGGTGGGMGGGARDGRVRIVAALVNPPGEDPRRETVTLINTTPARVDLAGWKLVDARENAERLAGAIEPHGVRTVRLAGTVQLGNRGGALKLVDSAGAAVDEVAYSREQAQEENRLVVFRG
ncbi:MAG TPA: DUF2278 family protein [Longimicrobium sp.]|jgi:uncharacterized protein YukJ